MVAITNIELCTNQSLCSVVVDTKLVNAKYLYYYLKGRYSDLRQISSGDGTRGGLNLSMIKEYKIPLMPLSEQNRIVTILDKFDTLVNDISIGLPAELAARRKQYEYYREKLLTFKELEK
jgi:type I restriction enzyme S subunit